MPAQIPDRVRVTSLSGIRELISELGGNPAAMLSKVGISPDALRDADAFIPFSAKVTLLEEIATALDAPFVGLQLARKQSLDVLGPLSMVSRTSATVGDALEAIVKFLPIHTPNVTAEVSIDGDKAIMTERVDAFRGNQDRQIFEHCLGLLLKTFRAIFSPDFSPDALYLASPAPPVNSSHLEDFFQCDLNFDAPICSMEFHRSILDAELAARNPELNSIVTNFLEKEAQAEDALVEKHVRKLIKDLLPIGQCSLPAIASHLGMHERSLQNALNREGQEFRKLLELTRQELAAEYLAGSNIPISEIAALVGYSDQATFTRAFSSWTGRAPLRFRKANPQRASSMA